MDKTAELLKAMTQVRIENSVRQFVMRDTLGQIAALRTRRGATPADVRRYDLLGGVSAAAIGARWIDDEKTDAWRKRMLAGGSPTVH